MVVIIFVPAHTTTVENALELTRLLTQLLLVPLLQHLSLELLQQQLLRLLLPVSQSVVNARTRTTVVITFVPAYTTTVEHAPELTMLISSPWQMIS
jgi:hypothetical protein